MFCKINLGDIARYHSLRPKADTGEKHFHLLGCSVLRFIENDEGLVQRASAHKGERGHFDCAALKLLAGFIETHQIVKCVI